MNMEIRISNADRAKVRAAIKDHPAWTAWRTARGLTMADMTSAKCVEFCADHGLDVSAIIADAPDAPETPETPEEDTVTLVEPVKPAPRAVVTETPDDLGTALVALKKALGGSVDADAVRAIVEEAVAPLRAIVEDAAPVLLVEQKDGQQVKVEGLRHREFDRLVKACMARDTAGRRLNVWLAGPTQSGKTTAAEKTAEALGLSFGFHGAMTMAHELTGFVDASGKYHETQFVKAYREGGCVLLDEVDAGSNEALLCLNAALANGQMPLPTGEMLHRHPDFLCIGAANTWGNGATADYVGRAKIDAAFMQRFPVKLAWGYDEKLEAAMCGNPDFARRVQRARDRAATAGLKVLITPAHSKAGAALIASGFSEDDAAKLTYLSGLSDAQVKQVEG